MSPDIAGLLHDAEGLEPHELATLVHELLRILDGDPQTADADIERAWADEAAERLREIDSGSVQLVDGRETLALARAELSRTENITR